MCEICGCKTESKSKKEMGKPTNAKFYGWLVGIAVLAFSVSYAVTAWACGGAGCCGQCGL